MDRDMVASLFQGIYHSFHQSMGPYYISPNRNIL